MSLSNQNKSIVQLLDAYNVVGQLEGLDMMGDNKG